MKINPKSDNEPLPLLTIEQTKISSELLYYFLMSYPKQKMARFMDNICPMKKKCQK